MKNPLIKGAATNEVSSGGFHINSKTKKMFQTFGTDVKSKNKYISYNPKLKDVARELRKNQTPTEKKLWYQYLKDYTPKFKRQKPLNEYIVDFYCSQAKLVIEVDGDTHYNEKALEYDKRRTMKLTESGLKVLRFTNIDIAQHFDGVCIIIDNEVQKRI